MLLKKELENLIFKITQVIFNQYLNFMNHVNPMKIRIQK